MLINWLYNNPIWLVGGVILLISMAVACAGLVIFDRFVSIELRRNHNDVTGFTIAIVGVVYAVLLAFIAVATWQAFSDASAIVGSEANYLGNIYRDTAGLPNDMAVEVRGHLKQYAKLVIDEEWPAQQAGHIVTSGWAPLDDFHIDIARFQPKTGGETVIQAEILHALNELYSARESRLTAASGHVAEIVWWIIIVGGAITIGYTYLFGMQNFCMHLLMTAGVTASMTLVVILIVELDYPFRGSVSVSSEPFQRVLGEMNTLTFQHD
jgi:hypothetical protein